MTRPLSPYQRGLQHFNGTLFCPDSASAGGRGLGGVWTTGAGVTVTHATPASELDTQQRRTIYSNSGGGGTNDQELGVRQTAAGDYAYWMGNYNRLGGWYFSTIFRLEAWNNNAGRFFAGLSASANAIVASDTVPQNTIGLWHDTTDGADATWIVIRGTGAVDKTHAVTTNALNPGLWATGATFIWEMWEAPFGISVTNTSYRLSWFETTHTKPDKPSVKLVEMNSIGGGPATNTFCAPQVQMSNGADTTAGHFSIGIANIYVTPHTGELDID